MKTDFTYINYRQTNSFSELVNDYINSDEFLLPFYQYSSNLDGIEKAINDRKKYSIDRQNLVNVLSDQYKNVPENEIVTNNIRKISEETTFTICTAHQPNLLTGYLYFFYKILHAIKMAEVLNEKYPNKHFVPVYYMGSEDNDLDELGQFNFEGKKYKWNANGQTGAVGRMKTESLTPIIEELFRSFGPPGAECENLKKLIEECYLNNETIANATQLIVHKLFGHYGLVVLNPDDANFKKEILPIMQDDLLNNSSLNIVQSQSQKLAERYKAQAFPRLINLFYLTDNIRERIEQKGEIWQVINTEIRFTKEELITELENHPEKFSPNVILRGLLQESILPNVCFIGGGSELAYWLQLKPLFEYHNVFYPVIYLRQSVQIISEEAWILMKQLGLNFEDVFVPTDDLIHKWILDKKGESWLLIEEKKVLENAFEALKIRALKIDTTLEKSASAVLTKMRHQIDVLEQKMYRAEKRKEQLNRTRLDKLKLMLLPNGALQERLENFMPYYLQNGFSIFATIKDEIKPFDNQFLIVYPSKIKD